MGDCLSVSWFTSVAHEGGSIFGVNAQLCFECDRACQCRGDAVCERQQEEQVGVGGLGGVMMNE